LQRTRPCSNHQKNDSFFTWNKNLKELDRWGFHRITFNSMPWSYQSSHLYKEESPHFWSFSAKVFVSF
jgi:hypothetical protein